MFLGLTERLLAKRFAGCSQMALGLTRFSTVPDILELCLTSKGRTAFLQRSSKERRRTGLRPASALGPNRRQWKIAQPDVSLCDICSGRRCGLVANRASL